MVSPKSKKKTTIEAFLEREPWNHKLLKIGAAPGAHVVCIDTGIYNPITAVFYIMQEDGTLLEDPDRPPLPLTAVEVRNATGERRRQRGQQHTLKKLQKVNTAFERAVDAMSAHAPVISGTDVALTIANARARYKAFPLVYAFYSHSTNSRNRFANYVGKQRAYAELARKFVPDAERTVVVVGDMGKPQSGSPISGSSDSRQGKLVAAIKNLVGADNFFFMEEFRSSCLDYVNHWQMMNPVGVRAQTTDTAKLDCDQQRFKNQRVHGMCVCGVCVCG